jgi:hypothetical protein
MTHIRGGIWENHVVEFETGRGVDWIPADVGRRPAPIP